MLEGGYEIYMMADASDGTSKEAQDYATSAEFMLARSP
jgi:hypothetical protein